MSQFAVPDSQAEQPAVCNAAASGSLCVLNLDRGSSCRCLDTWHRPSSVTASGSLCAARAGSTEPPVTVKYGAIIDEQAIPPCMASILVIMLKHDLRNAEKQEEGACVVLHPLQSTVPSYEPPSKGEAGTLPAP